jgi:hypothetical protein
MDKGPLWLLSGGVLGRTFIETGMVVIRDTHTRLFSERAARTERDLNNNIALHHEWVHYLQSITCAAVNFAAQEMLRLSAAVVSAAAQGGVPDALHQEICELTERLYGRRAEEPVRIEDRPGFTMLIPIPDSHQIGMLDLLEGVAVLESFKLCTKNARVEDYLQFRDSHCPGSEKSVYRWSFNWMANAIGPEASYELLGPVSFLALQTDAPEAEFVRIVKKLSEVRNLDFRALSRVKALAEIAYEKDWSCWLHDLEQGESERGHVTLNQCATFAVGQLGVEALTQFGATPGQVTAKSFEALIPPVTAYSGEDKVTLMIPKYAQGGLAESVIDWTATVGAAERLTIRAESDVYQFCPHGSECPHFESALCHRNFAPPGVSRSHEECRFPRTFRQLAKLEPSEIWAKMGRGLMNPRELVQAFEATTEGNLWAMVRRQRASIVKWLGVDGYNDLEWKCKATADKTLHALRTQDLQDFAEARMFWGAVVNEVRNLAREKTEGPAEDGVERGKELGTQ